MKRSLRDLLSEEVITLELDLGDEVEVDPSDVKVSVAEKEEIDLEAVEDEEEVEVEDVDVEEEDVDVEELEEMSSVGGGAISHGVQPAMKPVRRKLKKTKKKCVLILIQNTKN